MTSASPAIGTRPAKGAAGGAGAAREESQARVAAIRWPLFDDARPALHLAEPRMAELKGALTLEWRFRHGGVQATITADGETHALTETVSTLWTTRDNFIHVEAGDVILATFTLDAAHSIRAFSARSGLMARLGIRSMWLDHPVCVERVNR